LEFIDPKTMKNNPKANQVRPSNAFLWKFCVLEPRCVIMQTILF
jgi:hypothetical protein